MQRVEQERKPKFSMANAHKGRHSANCSAGARQGCVQNLFCSPVRERRIVAKVHPCRVATARRRLSRQMEAPGA